MLGVDDQTNRSTVEEQSINFVKYTIRPWARRIEQAVRRDLVIATRNYEAKYNLDALERGNLEARRNYWASALGEGGNRPGWMSVNEVRIA
jgi:phage portal protein BeeE